MCQCYAAPCTRVLGWDFPMGQVTFFITLGHIFVHLKNVGNNESNTKMSVFNLYLFFIWEPFFVFVWFAFGKKTQKTQTSPWSQWILKACIVAMWLVHCVRACCGLWLWLGSQCTDEHQGWARPLGQTSAVAQAAYAKISNALQQPQQSHQPACQCTGSNGPMVAIGQWLIIM